MKEWGIFSDESADHTSEEAVESQMYSREKAESRLAEIRIENGDDDDNCYVHEVEEPDEEEEDDDEEEDEEEGE
jgi:hypothetical protein